MSRSKKRNVSSKKTESSTVKYDLRETKSMPVSTFENNVSPNHDSPTPVLNLRKARGRIPDMDGSTDSATSDQTAEDTIISLKTTIDRLCERIFTLERTVEKLARCKEGKGINRHVSVETQTETETPNSPLCNTPMSYAEAAKSTPATQIHITNQADHAKNTTKKIEKQRKNDANRDSNFSRTYDVKTNGSNTLPHVLFIHDSTMAKIDRKRLGRSYGLHIISQKANKIADCKQHIENICPDDKIDCIVLHSGINDIKGTDPNVASKDLTAVVKQIKNRLPKTKVVVSRIAPVKDRILEGRRELFNALLFTELPHHQVSVISHENLHAESGKNMRDHIHPSNRGTSILAGNLGRHIHRLFWEQQRRRPPRKTARGPEVPNSLIGWNTQWYRGPAGHARFYQPWPYHQYHWDSHTHQNMW